MSHSLHNVREQTVSLIGHLIDKRFSYLVFSLHDNTLVPLILGLITLLLVVSGVEPAYTGAFDNLLKLVVDKLKL